MARATTMDSTNLILVCAGHVDILSGSINTQFIKLVQSWD